MENCLLGMKKIGLGNGIFRALSYCVLLRLSVEYDTREVSCLSFTVKILLLSGVMILVSIGNILWF